ncbi:MAG: sigma-70 family RNA polymerase sigma factor [Planctomycetota bacterium]
MDTTLLLEHLDWVHALAHRLVRDAHAADDLVQETWLAAERSAPVRPEAVRGWLARVLRRKVSERTRRERMRRHRESDAARREGVPSDADLHGKVEAEKRVVEAVMALEEPLRRTVLLRWFEGMTPSAIAATEGVSVSAVKGRLQRGHGQLRRRLDATFGGDGRTWVQALAPIAGMHAAKAPAAGGLAALVVAGAILAAASVAAALVWQDRRAETTGGELAAIESAPGTAGEDGAVVLAPRRTVEGRAAIPGEVASPSAKTPRTRTETLVVRIVEETTGAPVPGATAWVLDADQLADPLLLFLSGTTSRAERVERFGERVVAGPDGRASIAWSGLGAEVLAFGGDWHGSLRVDRRSEGRVDLPVVPSRVLGVRVVDEQGRPVAGSRFGLRTRGGDRGASAGITDGEGRGTIDLYGKLPLLAAKRGGVHELYVVPLVLGSDVTEEEPADRGTALAFDDDGAPLENPVVLTAPATGRVTLMRPDRIDSPWIVLLAPAPSHDADDRRLPFLGNSVAIDVSASPSRPRSVACRPGQTYVAVWFAGGELRKATFAGPAAAGTTCEVALVPDGGDSTGTATSVERGEKLPLRGRLVDERGSPVARARFDVALRRQGGESRTSASTDADGRFDVPDRMPAGAESAVDVFVEARVEGRDLYALVGSASYRLGAQEGLGDVVLRPLPELVSGTVVDPGGRPCAGAAVEVQIEVEVERLQDRERVRVRRWTLAERLFARWQRDGRFTLHAAPLDAYVVRRWATTGGLRLRATRGEFQSAWHVVEPGREVEIPLVTPTDLALTVAGLEPKTGAGFTAELVPEGSSERVLGHRVRRRFTWKRTQPGTYDVLLGHEQFKEPIHAIRGVRVEPSGCEDPRLVDLDLERFVTHHSVTVLRHDGAPAKGVTVWVHREDGSNGASGHRTDDEGRLVVVSRPGSPRRVRLGQHGEIDWDEEPTLLLEDTTFHLERPFTIRVRLRSDRPLGDGSRSIAVSAHSEGRRGAGIPPAGPPDDDGWTTYELKEPGRYALRFGVLVGSGGPVLDLSDLEPGAVVDVIEEGQLVEIEVPDAVFGAARELGFRPSAGRGARER